MKESPLTLRPIGIIRTPYKTKYGAPRQPGSSKERTTGIITLHEHENFEQALEDLVGFDYVWVLFWFHANTGWKPKVLPPNSGRVKKGLFATRSPHRPNPIGLSLCRLLEVRGRTLRVENPDMLDGTPVLDIKPYLPHAESHPDAHSGWIGRINERTTPSFKVQVAREVRSVMKDIAPEERREIVQYLKAILARDPLPHTYRRIKALPDGSSVIAVKRWRFMFQIDGTTVHVFGVAHDRERGSRE